MKRTERDQLAASGWTLSPRFNPPPPDVAVEVAGSDYMGTWFSTAMRKDYKPGSTKGQLRRGWRWCLPDGEVFDDQDVEAWRLMLDAKVTGQAGERKDDEA